MTIRDDQPLPDNIRQERSENASEPHSKGERHDIAVEISLRRQAEGHLHAAEERLQLMIAGAEDYGFFVMDVDGRIISWNQGAQHVFGWHESEILGQPFRLLFTEDDRLSGIPEQELKTAAQKGVADDDRWHLRKDGSRFWAHGVTTSLKNKRVRGFAKLVRDLTERKLIEENLRQSEESYRTLIEQVKDYAIFRTDTHGRAVTWNRGVERVLGYGEHEFLGHDITTRIFTPEDIQAGVPQRELDEAERTGAASNNRWMMKKGGNRFYAEGMTTALRDEQGRLVGFTKVMQDQTDQKRRDEQLVATTRQLATANEQKDRFLAVLSHELRNPMAPIRMAADLICDESSLDPVTQEACGILQHQVQVMVHLINDLLEASRITSGKVRLQTRVLDLREPAKRAVESTRPLIKGRKQRLSISLPDDPIWLDADPVRLEQIIVNLLTNAAKYTPDGGNIWLTVERKPDTAMVRVRDNGEGIAPEVLPQMFALFSQADRSIDHSEGGMGIGLALVRSLVELHHGTVEARSEGLGQGSEFIVQLPISDHVCEEVQPAAAAPGERASLRILVVDDNVDAAKLMRMLLTAQGYEVRAEHNGVAGLRAAEEFEPHVILLDIGMPGMNGFEFAQHVRGRSHLESVRLVAVTGYGQDLDVQRTKAVGIDDHLVKPVERTTLMRILESVQPS